MWPLVIAVVLVIVIGNIDGYASGAPEEQCNAMTPNHAAVSQPLSKSPYTISLSAATYGCKDGEEITVTISGTKKFAGFLCQPRTDVNLTTTSGTLTARNNKIKSVCTTSITHTSSETKSNLSFQWKSATSQTVFIVCTLVQSKTTFWVRQSSKAIQFNKTNCEAITTPIVAPIATPRDSASATTPRMTLLICLLLYVKLFNQSSIYRSLLHL